MTEIIHVIKKQNNHTISKFISINRSVCLSVCLSICLSVYLSVCQSVYLSGQMTKNIHLISKQNKFIKQFISKKSICLSVYLSVCLSICLSVYLSVCQPVNLSVCLSVSTDDQKYTHDNQVKYIHYFKIHIYKSICLSV